jgi:hypothetical protein
MKVNPLNQVACFPPIGTSPAPERSAAVSQARPDYAAAFARNWKNLSAGKLDSRMKNLEAQDKLGNFEIQDLMSRYNQAETLASSVAKKVADTTNAVAGKI